MPRAQVPPSFGDHRVAIVEPIIKKAVQRETHVDEEELRKKKIEVEEMATSSNNVYRPAGDDLASIRKTFIILRRSRR